MRVFLIPKSLAKMIMTQSHGSSLLVDVAENPWDYECITCGSETKPNPVALAKVKYANRKIYSLYDERGKEQSIITVNYKDR